MRIGIFMAYGPGTVMGKEGLGRYIGNLIKGFADAGETVVLSIPKWSVQTVNDLLDEFDVPESAIELAVLEKVPAFWGMITFLKKYRRKKLRTSRKYRILRTATEVLEWFAGTLIRGTNMLLFIAMLLLMVIAGVLMIPLTAAAALAVVLYYILKKLRKKATCLKDIAETIFDITQQFSKTGERLDRYAYEQMMSKINQMLVDKANRQNVDVWFIPALFWPEVKGLKQTRVITVPDVVTTKFPVLCSDLQGAPEQAKKCVDTIKDGSYFITYCDYIREDLLEHQFGKFNGVTIEHANNEISHLIHIDEAFEKKLNAQKNFTDAFARAVLQTLIPHSVLGANVLCGYSFANTRYIFYASQVRPYKNILNLLRAYEELLRKRYVDVKLILTCDPKQNKQVETYIQAHKLQYDVLCFYNCSAQQLAALYRCADLVVTPTLYEGGFPFTFGEGMSVGTPSVMSDIPQVRPLVEQYGLAEEMLFDPYDWKAMADKIEYALEHREELYQKELPLYSHFAERTNELVAKEYLNAFRHFMALDTAKQVRVQ